MDKNINDFSEITDIISETAKEIISSEEYEIECPNCGKSFTSAIGQTTCPNCKSEINLTLDTDF